MTPEERKIQYAKVVIGLVFGFTVLLYLHGIREALLR